MSWDPVWERIFQNRESWGRYPPEELIRFVATHYYAVPARRKVAFLEVGCGPGAGPSWYIAREGFHLTGIDGSPTAIERARASFANEGLQGVFHVGDLTSLPWPDGAFDCVVDVAALQHNDETDAARIVGEIFRVLRPGGRHFSLTVREGSWGHRSGTQIDATSWTGVAAGPYAGAGLVRFATRESLERMYSAFEDIEIDYAIRSLANAQQVIANWVVTAVRRS